MPAELAITAAEFVPFRNKPPVNQFHSTSLPLPPSSSADWHDGGNTYFAPGPGMDGEGEGDDFVVAAAGSSMHSFMDDGPALPLPPQQQPYQQQQYLYPRVDVGLEWPPPSLPAPPRRTLGETFFLPPLKHIN